MGCASSGTARRIPVWKTPDITADSLKNFACIMMFFSSVGITVIENEIIHIDQYTQESLSLALANDSRLMFFAGLGSVLQLLGGLSVTIFAFLLVEGFLNTRNYRKFLYRVATFALVSEIPYDLAVCGKPFDLSGQNALFSMTVCLCLLYLLCIAKKRRGISGVFMKVFFVLCAVAWVSLLHAAYGLCLVLLTAVFYLFYSRNGWKTFLGAAVSLLYVTGPLAFYGIWCYNGVRKDRIPKYVYYGFYPMHLLALWGISMAYHVLS